MNSEWEMILANPANAVDNKRVTIEGLALKAKAEIKNFNLEIPSTNKNYVKPFLEIYICHVEKIKNTEGITKEDFIHQANIVVENYKVFATEFLRLLKILQDKYHSIPRGEPVRNAFKEAKEEFGRRLKELIDDYNSDCITPPIDLAKFRRLNIDLRKLMRTYNRALNEHIEKIENKTALIFGAPFDVAAPKGPVIGHKGPYKGKANAPIVPDEVPDYEVPVYEVPVYEVPVYEGLVNEVPVEEPMIPTAVYRGNKEVKKGQQNSEILMNEYIKNVPNCNGSPVFGDIIMEEIKNTLGTSYKLQNRTGLQKELYLQKDLEKRKAVIRKFENLCNWEEDGFSNIGQIIISTSDENDILIVYGALGEIKGFAKVEKSNIWDDPNSYDMVRLCSNTPNVGSFLLASYMLALKHLNANCGYLTVYQDYDNLPALCLYDKFGFVEDVHSINRDKDVLHLKVDLASKSKMAIINTYKKNEGNKIKKTEPLCSPEFKLLDANSQREIIEERRESLSKLNRQADAKIYRRKTKKRIQQILNPNGTPIDSRKSTPRSNKPSRQPSPLVESQKSTRKSSSTPMKSQKSSRKSNSPEKPQMESQPIQQSINNSLETSLVNNVTNSTETPIFSENPLFKSPSNNSPVPKSSLANNFTESSLVNKLDNSPENPNFSEKPQLKSQSISSSMLQSSLIDNLMDSSRKSNSSEKTLIDSSSR